MRRKMLRTKRLPGLSKNAKLNADGRYQFQFATPRVRLRAGVDITLMPPVGRALDQPATRAPRAYAE